MVKEYEGKELEKLLGKSRTQILRLAKEENWQIVKKKVGRTYKNFYLAESVDNYIKALEEKEASKPARVRTVIKKEATTIDELPLWNQRVAWARYILCNKLEEQYSSSAGSKLEIVENFVENASKDFPQQMEVIKKLSVPTLRRWFGVYLKNKTNPLALSSGHGTNKGVRRIDTEVLEAIRGLYKSKNKPNMMFVYERIVAAFGTDAISYGTMRNYIKYDMTSVEKDKARMGAKEFKDTYSPYIIRGYDDIKAGQVWMSDGHDLEMMCYRGNKKKANGERYYGSPKLIVWIDVKSRLITGWTLSWTETTESIAIALKRGIEKYGVPEQLFTDNGKAYKSKVLKGTDELDGIYASLGLEVSHALPYNAQSKHIERWFVDFKETFTKSSITYKGGNISERPERMKSFAMDKIAKGKILEQEELEAALEAFINYKNHSYYALRRETGRKAHRGRGMNNRTPLEVFNEENPVGERKMLSDEKLRLLFLYEEIRTIQQNGIEYLGNTYEHENLYFHQKEKVKIKFDPHDLRSIYVYLETGEFLCKADKLQTAGWSNDIDSIKAKANRHKKIAKLEKLIIGIREEEREETGIIEYNFEKKEEEKLIEVKKKKKEIYLGNGIYQVID
ncbi:transposase family protein [uncultured Fusobacterium sp.]|uniref:transposase family protein n=1 Tax=uncultured Fusobacterium sp. TaxID=159267 RepID=UPI0025FF7291|nr:transposase family protein [uncultured Fusobacterium sp.]